ncbi:hypothetical protein AVEN_230372-1 [Araneus ventricosus]|uniref:Uncharacterized protein n=1 Tax=Araneus ventricosus TaxID=182803 RepID=A0A4Y2VSK2_ARAVE|nr:hypothetical protein AVEN_230372-1 [Araneus ventricosus]
MAAFLSKRQSNQTTDIEMEDCANYESFCCSIKATKKSRFSSFFTTGDSDSDDFNWVEDNSNGWDNDSGDIEWDDDNSDIEWTNDEQSCQDEIMDNLEIVFEEHSEEFKNEESVYGVCCRTEFPACGGKQSEMSAFIRKINRDWNEANKDNNKNRRSATKCGFNRTQLNSEGDVLNIPIILNHF